MNPSVRREANGTSQRLHQQSSPVVKGPKMHKKQILEKQITLLIDSINKIEMHRSRSIYENHVVIIASILVYLHDLYILETVLGLQVLSM